MKLRQLNTMLTLTANLAVLIGIVLVILELRQNDDTLNATIQLSLSESYEQLATFTVEHGAYADALVRAFDDPESLDGMDYLNLLSVQYRHQLVLHTTYNLYLEGIVSEAFWREKASHFTITFLEIPITKTLFDQAQHEEMFSADFIAAIEAIYQEQKAAREAMKR